MGLKTAVIAGCAGLVAVGMVAATTLSLGNQDGAIAAEAATAGFAGFHNGFHKAGWGRHGRRGGLAMMCSEARGERVEEMIAFVENFMAFTPEQRTAWDELAGAVRDGNTEFDQACDQVKDLRDEEAAPARLELVEAFMSTGLDVMRRVRPAFDRFYGTLNETQQKALDDLMRHRRHRRT